ncbi:MAG: excinuclease ABC subunit UvrA, partial [Planctomycetota bacterium]|nr:excinuclease ABC subunit UvrA [Planctomycetota bacterium]
VIKTADWIIDLGPEGGAGGGTIVAQGTPEDIAACAASQTGLSLRGAGLGKPLRKSRRKAQVDAFRIPASELSNGKITIRGASQHNLQQIDLEIPRNRMSVFCGPSGSGKTSLAMDTLYAEGQRRYVESLSAYARQFLGQMPKPKVDHIHGLSPSIAIEQKSVGHTPRSTVGTVTEIYDYFRILYARLGQPVCPDCDIPVDTQTTDEVINQILEHPDKTRVLILAPQEVTVGQSYERFWESLKARGFTRVRIDGTSYRIEDVPEINRRRKHQVEIVVDRVNISRRQRSRLAESVEAAFGLGKGQLLVALADDDRDETDWKVDHYSLHFACGTCGRSFEELTPHNFSFNSSLGWCAACEGLGIEQGTNPAALIADPARTLLGGAIAAWPDFERVPMFRRIVEAVAHEFQIPLDVPYKKLSPKHQRIVLYGTGNRWIDCGGSPEADANASQVPTFRIQYKGLYPAIEETSRISYVYRHRVQDHIGEVACSACQGSRLRDDAAAVQLNGKTLGDLCNLPMADALVFLKSTRLKGADKKIAGDLLTEAVSRLTFLVDVGLHYLSLSRPLPTLSGGETQRIRLAGQIGRALTGVLYVLDEPTIGLHPRDNTRLISALTKLRNLGNTVLLVEHDREVLESSDRLYDFGPGAGRFGGTVVDQGTPKQVTKRNKSLTGQFLSHSKSIPVPASRRMTGVDETPPGGGWLELIGARQNNLRNVDLKIPLGTLTCITGVSGSGKSSLIEDTLAKAIAKKLHRASDNAGPHTEIRGLDQINKIIVVDQHPIGNTPASNPATYTGVFEHIRELFTRLPESRVRGFRPGRFSFNRKGGRCDACEGLGQKCIEMHFLPDVWVECDVCRGKRYNLETLAVTYNNRSIADVLDMPIGDALELFQNIPKIRGFLATLVAVGLDYLTLGQSAPTLSGGEAQRVKLASELARPQTGQTLYVLDEPTTGLHFDDIAKLLKVLNSLVEQGNTVVVIEHNLDVVKTADWLVDIGPEAGTDGGWIVGTGTPEQLVARFGTPPSPVASPRKKTARKKAARKAKRKSITDSRTPESGDGLPNGPLRSWTAECLLPVLEAANRAERDIFDVEAAAEHQDGDMDMRAFGREQKMPWQRDGRRWHTREKIANSGKRCRWEGAALDYVIDFFADDERFEPPDWNDQARVELTANRKLSKEWFLHAQTGDEWLLQLRFRVKKGTFDVQALDARLGLKPVDDINELEVYGRGNRVRDMPRSTDWQELVVSVHWKKEIDTPEFREFLIEARDSYLSQVDANSKLSIDDHSPWKKLGKKWHLMRKGFPANKTPKWKAEVLEHLIDDIEHAIPGIVFDWTARQFVYGKRPEDDANLFCICTKRRAGLDFTLFVPAGTLALGRISALGTEREIKPHKDDRDAVRLRFLRTNQLGNDVRELLGSFFID